MRITRAEAQGFFAHPSQNRVPFLDRDLPDDLVMYWADGPVCIVSHWLTWPGVMGGHIGVKPEAWGKTEAHVLRLLNEIWAAQGPTRLVGWINESNRAMRALCLRVGMEQDGRLPLAEPVLMFGWRP